MATNALIDALPLPEPSRTIRLAAAAAKLDYWQKRNAQARASHTKTRRAQLIAHNIELEQIPHCRPG